MTDCTGWRSRTRPTRWALASYLTDRPTQSLHWVEVTHTSSRPSPSPLLSHPPPPLSPPPPLPPPPGRRLQVHALRLRRAHGGGADVAGGGRGEGGRGGHFPAGRVRAGGGGGGLARAADAGLCSGVCRVLRTFLRLTFSFFTYMINVVIFKPKVVPVGTLTLQLVRVQSRACTHVLGYQSRSDDGSGYHARVSTGPAPLTRSWIL